MDGTSDDKKPEPSTGSPEPEAKPEPNPRSSFFVDDPEYQTSLKEFNYDELSMSAEADKMTPSDDVSFEEDGSLKYAVPMHLMGLLVGRQKQTMRRIMNMSSTELEQGSWTHDGLRLMGFKMLGSTEGIKKAVDLMIATIRTMESDKAASLMRNHIRIPKKTPKKKSSKKPETKEPGANPKEPGANPKEPGAKPSKPAPAPKKANGKKLGGRNPGGSGSKSEICPHYLKGKCSFGIKCRNSHSRGGN